MPFGAAAGFVHPATGYSVRRGVSGWRRESPPRSPRVTIRGRSVARAGKTRARAAALGLSALLSLSAHETRQFFELFF